jgi:hypothetical protein
MILERPRLLSTKVIFWINSAKNWKYLSPSGLIGVGLDIYYFAQLRRYSLIVADIKTLGRKRESIACVIERILLDMTSCMNSCSYSSVCAWWWFCSYLVTPPPLLLENSNNQPCALHVNRGMTGLGHLYRWDEWDLVPWDWIPLLLKARNAADIAGLTTGFPGRTSFFRTSMHDF